MSAGTLSLTNKSAAVSGTGTSFATELKVGDFIVFNVGGTAYTIPVKAITNNTQLTLISNYTGPTQSGVAWFSVPQEAQSLISSALATQSAEALRGLNYDKMNWQQVFSATGNVTVTLPDGSSFTGPSWGNITTSLNGKADKTSLGGAAYLEVGTSGGTVAAGNDSRFGTVDGKTGGNIAGTVTVYNSSSGLSGARAVISPGALDVYGAPNAAGAIYYHFGASDQYTSRFIEIAAGTMDLQSASGISRFRVAGGFCSRAGLSGVFGNNYWNLYYDGSTKLYIDTTLIGNISTTAVSDRRLKKDISYVTDEDTANALDQVMQWKPATYKFKARGELIPESEQKLGVIANDLVEISPECVSGKGLDDSYDGINPYDAYWLNTDAMIMKLAMAVQQQHKIIQQLKTMVEQTS
ncbi:tail fiber domain-containing protein [Cronobacter turicensis]|uniref:tail fiber domain-containing protein n=1 Tax=Cronobacter turicensis TaxID=413502 RepID=UPI001DDC03DF|nr:tail fiber domain-containing protein [Cronobacter turicensis]EGT4490683.1 tail fiber domain-containing protein [Cronobacter turicensis]MDI6417449.1 tail fiber domain-containing protein [Cronobacter turicensis]MDI6463946.1 tail fiber domain-containing protein [Cronobacter turicensis]MDI7673289.1 tail fiber domain-containing protein [Cronobacter turicensis]